jgi:hypothetical protein
MKKLLLTTVFALTVPAVSAQTMPPPVAANSASTADLATLQSVIATNEQARQPFAVKEADAEGKLRDAKAAVAQRENQCRSLGRWFILAPDRQMPHDAFVAYVEQQMKHQDGCVSQMQRILPKRDDELHLEAEQFVRVEEYRAQTNQPSSAMIRAPSDAQLSANVNAAAKAVDAAKADLAAFDGKAAKAIALAKLVQANIDAVKAHEEQIAADEQRKADEAAAKVREQQAEAAATARAEAAVKQAEADQVRAREEQAAADEAAKIDEAAAAKRAEAAAIRQKAAETRKAAADATAAAKAEEERAAAQEQDAKVAEEIAKAPPPPVKRQWWVEMLEPAHQCEVSTRSPADAVEAVGGRIEDKGQWVNVSRTMRGATQTASFFRTKEACERSKEAHDQANAEAAHRLDQYR